MEYFRTDTVFNFSEQAQLAELVHGVYSTYKPIGYQAWKHYDEFKGSIYSSVKAITGKGNNGNASSFIRGIDCLIKSYGSEDRRSLTVAFDNAIGVLEGDSLTEALHTKLKSIAVELAQHLGFSLAYVERVSLASLQRLQLLTANKVKPGNGESFHLDPHSFSVNRCWGKQKCVDYRGEHFATEALAIKSAETKRNAVFNHKRLPLMNQKEADEAAILIHETMETLVGTAYELNQHMPEKVDRELERLVGEKLRTIGFTQFQPNGDDNPGDWLYTNSDRSVHVEVKGTVLVTTATDNNVLSAVKKTGQLLQQNKEYANTIVVTLQYETTRNGAIPGFVIEGICDTELLWRKAGLKKSGDLAVKNGSIMWAKTSSFSTAEDFILAVVKANS